ncbi:MAG: class I SAM-dependent methyltransferase [Acidobacteriia bacterium]|nr:class I SAM-dependent methyltransferase [Terriglobia bacterium]
MSLQAFDEIAESYDGSFTDTMIGRELRQIIWRNLQGIFQPGAHVLELNCGTGEDAVWLAGRKVRVLATDGSSAMLETAGRKAVLHGMSDKIEFLQLDLASPFAGWPDFKFDGALSNFGGLNCVSDLGPLAGMLAQRIRPGGHLIMVLMGRWCFWEILWYMLRLQPQVAFRRRLQGGRAARIGNGSIGVWYPSVGTLRRIFSPQFRLRRLLGLGVFLPPSYLQEAITRRRHLHHLLRRLETLTAATWIFGRFGDHILFDFERTTVVPRDHR